MFNRALRIKVERLQLDIGQLEARLDSFKPKEDYHLIVYCEHNEKFELRASWDVSKFAYSSNPYGGTHTTTYFAIPATIWVPFEDGAYYLQAQWSLVNKRYELVNECPHTRKEKTS